RVLARAGRLRTARVGRRDRDRLADVDVDGNRGLARDALEMAARVAAVARLLTAVVAVFPRVDVAVATLLAAARVEGAVDARELPRARHPDRGARRAAELVAVAQLVAVDDAVAA